jgi:Na+/H+-dicarboxylate symporter
VFKPVGDAFIRFLQMAVLPYFAIALPLGFGRLSSDEAKTMGLRLLMLLLLCWSICFLVVIALPLAFPKMESASFFSTSAVEVDEGVDFINLYIPANPFRSLADAVVPGVVVFGISLGIALIRVPDKERLLGILHSLADALTRITGFVVKLTPIGVFALSASAAGTMTIEELSRLQVYLAVYTIGAVVLALWFLPMLVTCMTSFKYMDVLRVTRDPMITGFTTGNLLVVLAMLADNCKSLFQKYKEEDRVHAESIVDVSLPIAFTFPSLGVVLILLFVPFSAWFTGNPIGLVEYPKFLLLGFFSFFGSVEIGLPFLLKNLSIPTDMIQLHIITLVYIGRVATFLAVMHMAVLAILTAVPKQHEKPSFRRFMYFGFTSVLLLIITVVATRAVLYQTVDRSYTKYNVIAEMQTVLQPLRAEVFTEPYTQTPTPLKDGQNLLDRIEERGHMRVGYDPDGLPFSFFNAKQELVGFDVELIQAFANDMKYDLHFYPYQKSAMKEVVNNGQYDLVIGGLMTTPERMRDFLFSPEYM